MHLIWETWQYFKGALSWPYCEFEDENIRLQLETPQPNHLRVQTGWYMIYKNRNLCLMPSHATTALAVDLQPSVHLGSWQTRLGLGSIPLYSTHILIYTYLSNCCPERIASMFDLSQMNGYYWQESLTCFRYVGNCLAIDPPYVTARVFCHRYSFQQICSCLTRLPIKIILRSPSSWSDTCN